MEYKLFTFPNCGHCTEIKKYLNDKHVPYEEINIGLTSGKKNPVWHMVYARELEKDEKGLVLPILAEMNEGKLERITQNEKIKQIFG